MSSSTQAAGSSPSHASYGITLTILIAGEAVYSTDLTRPVELGRQRMDEAGPYSLISLDDHDRIVIAELSESTISRRHVSVEPVSAEQVRVENLSSVNTIWIDSSKPLATRTKSELNLPVFLTLGNVDLAILVYASPDRDDGLQSLAQPTALPGAENRREPASLDEVIRMEQAVGDSRLLIAWLKNTMEVFQSAASSPDFLPKAARAAMDIVGLDHVAILSWRDRQWHIDSSCHKLESEATDDWAPSRSLLERVRQQKRTFWKTPHGEASVRDHASLMNLEAYVASPILDSSGDVIGALYGERTARDASFCISPITELEAMLVELLSCSAAAGIARLEQEQAAIQVRVLFEQFFTPELSRQLETDPGLLSGKDANVTVLFCDIRGFSRISESRWGRTDFRLDQFGHGGAVRLCYRTQRSVGRLHR